MYNYNINQLLTFNPSVFKSNDRLSVISEFYNTYNINLNSLYRNCEPTIENEFLKVNNLNKLIYIMYFIFIQDKFIMYCI